MSYVQDKERIFQEEYIKIPRLRSEARMKKYSSSEDIRSWCDEVEDRRQHFIKYLARNKGSICKEGILPIDIFSGSYDPDLQKLRDKIKYLEALLDIYRDLKLTDNQKEKLADLQKELDEEKKKEKAESKTRQQSREPDRKRRASSDMTKADGKSKKKRERSEPDFNRKGREKRARKPSSGEAGSSTRKRTRSFPETSDKIYAKDETVPKISRIETKGGFKDKERFREPPGNVHVKKPGETARRPDGISTRIIENEGDDREPAGAGGTYKADVFDTKKSRSADAVGAKKTDEKDNVDKRAGEIGAKKLGTKRTGDREPGDGAVTKKPDEAGALGTKKTEDKEGARKPRVDSLGIKKSRSKDGARKPGDAAGTERPDESDTKRAEDTESAREPKTPSKADHFDVKRVIDERGARKPKSGDGAGVLDEADTHGTKNEADTHGTKRTEDKEGVRRPVGSHGTKKPGEGETSDAKKTGVKEGARKPGKVAGPKGSREIVAAGTSDVAKPLGETKRTEGKGGTRQMGTAAEAEELDIANTLGNKRTEYKEGNRKPRGADETMRFDEVDTFDTKRAEGGEGTRKARDAAGARRPDIADIGKTDGKMTARKQRDATETKRPAVDDDFGTRKAEDIEDARKPGGADETKGLLEADAFGSKRTGGETDARKLRGAAETGKPGKGGSLGSKGTEYEEGDGKLTVPGSTKRTVDAVTAAKKSGKPGVIDTRKAEHKETVSKTADAFVAKRHDEVGAHKPEGADGTSRSGEAEASHTGTLRKTDGISSKKTEFRKNAREPEDNGATKISGEAAPFGIRKTGEVDVIDIKEADRIDEDRRKQKTQLFEKKKQEMQSKSREGEGGHEREDVYKTARKSASIPEDKNVNAEKKFRDNEDAALKATKDRGFKADEKLPGILKHEEVSKPSSFLAEKGEEKGTSSPRTGKRSKDDVAFETNLSDKKLGEGKNLTTMPKTIKKEIASKPIKATSYMNEVSASGKKDKTNREKDPLGSKIVEKDSKMTGKTGLNPEESGEETIFDEQAREGSRLQGQSASSPAKQILEREKKEDYSKSQYPTDRDKRDEKMQTLRGHSGKSGITKPEQDPAERGVITENKEIQERKGQKGSQQKFGAKKREEPDINDTLEMTSERAIASAVSKSLDSKLEKPRKVDAEQEVKSSERNEKEDAVRKPGEKLDTPVETSKDEFDQSKTKVNPDEKEVLLDTEGSKKRSKPGEIRGRGRVLSKEKSKEPSLGPKKNVENLSELVKRTDDPPTKIRGRGKVSQDNITKNEIRTPGKTSAADIEATKGLADVDQLGAKEGEDKKKDGRPEDQMNIGAIGARALGSKIGKLDDTTMKTDAKKAKGGEVSKSIVADKDWDEKKLGVVGEVSEKKGVSKIPRELRHELEGPCDDPESLLAEHKAKLEGVASPATDKQRDTRREEKFAAKDKLTAKYKKDKQIEALKQQEEKGEDRQLVATNLSEDSLKREYDKLRSWSKERRPVKSEKDRELSAQDSPKDTNIAKPSLNDRRLPDNIGLLDKGITKETEPFKQPFAGDKSLHELQAEKKPADKEGEVAGVTKENTKKLKKINGKTDVEKSPELNFKEKDFVKRYAEADSTKDDTLTQRAEKIPEDVAGSSSNPKFTKEVLSKKKDLIEGDSARKRTKKEFEGMESAKSADKMEQLSGDIRGKDEQQGHQKKDETPITKLRDKEDQRSKEDEKDIDEVLEVEQMRDDEKKLQDASRVEQLKLGRPISKVAFDDYVRERFATLESGEISEIDKLHEKIEKDEDQWVEEPIVGLRPDLAGELYGKKEKGLLPSKKKKTRSRPPDEIDNLMEVGRDYKSEEHLPTELFESGELDVVLSDISIPEILEIPMLPTELSFTRSGMPDIDAHLDILDERFNVPRRDLIEPRTSTEVFQEPDHLERLDKKIPLHQIETESGYGIPRSGLDQSITSTEVLFRRPDHLERDIAETEPDMVIVDKRYAIPRQDLSDSLTPTDTIFRRPNHLEGLDEVSSEALDNELSLPIGKIIKDGDMILKDRQKIKVGCKAICRAPGKPSLSVAGPNNKRKKKPKTAEKNQEKVRGVGERFKGISSKGRKKKARQVDALVREQPDNGIEEKEGEEEEDEENLEEEEDEENVVFRTKKPFEGFEGTSRSQTDVKTTARPAKGCRASCNIHQQMTDERDDVFLSAEEELLIPELDASSTKEEDSQFMNSIPSGSLVSANEGMDFKTASSAPDDQFSFRRPGETIAKALEAQRKSVKKCQAICRNAELRKSPFGEETGGIILLKVQSPQAGPSGYYQEDLTPRGHLPDWASLPAASFQHHDTHTTLSISDDESIENKRANDSQLKEALSEQLEPDKRDEPMADIPTTGSVVSRVLSGQTVGVGIVPVRTYQGPLTLPEAILQQKSHTICKAPCNFRPIEGSSTEDELLGTAEDVSEIHTESEIAFNSVSTEPRVEIKIPELQELSALEDELTSSLNTECYQDSEKMFSAQEVSVDYHAVAPLDAIAEETQPELEQENKLKPQARKLSIDTTQSESPRSYASTMASTIRHPSPSASSISSAESIPQIAIAEDLPNKFDSMEETDSVVKLPTKETIDESKHTLPQLDVSPAIPNEVFYDAVEDPTPRHFSLEEMSVKYSVEHASEPRLSKSANSLSASVSDVTFKLDVGEKYFPEELNSFPQENSALIDKEVCDGEPFGIRLPSEGASEVSRTSLIEEQFYEVKPLQITTAEKSVSVKKSLLDQGVVTILQPKSDEAVSALPQMKSEKSATLTPRPESIQTETELQVRDKKDDRYYSWFKGVVMPQIPNFPKRLPCGASCAQQQGKKTGYKLDRGVSEDRPPAIRPEKTIRGICPDICPDAGLDKSYDKGTSSHSLPRRDQTNVAVEASVVRENVTQGVSCNCDRAKGKSQSTPSSPRPGILFSSKAVQNRSLSLRNSIDDLENRTDKYTSTVDSARMPCKARCAALRSLDKDVQIEELLKMLETKEDYCAEQRKIASSALQQLDTIKSIVEERDELQKKLKTSHAELEELKKNFVHSCAYGDLRSQCSKASEDCGPFESESKKHSQDIQIYRLEQEINLMKSHHKISPDQETQIMKKELEVLKKYCAKLSSIQNENGQLKKRNKELEDRMVEFEQYKSVEELKQQLNDLTKTTLERDQLYDKVQLLEKELFAYETLPNNIDDLMKRSMLLDDVIKDRDRLAKRVEQLRGIDEEVVTLRFRAERVNELERQLRFAYKDLSQTENELDTLRHKCACAEIEAINHKTETDNLRSRIICMEHEMESLKSISKDQEVLQMEKERLQNSLDELVRMQDDYDQFCVQLKAIDVIKAEKDMYRRKYESLIGLEKECEILRCQLDKAADIEKDRDVLEHQVENLEKCIGEQEDEIKRLVSHIDSLAKGREEYREKMKEIVSSLRLELNEKNSVVQKSEEKICALEEDMTKKIEVLSEKVCVLQQENENLQCDKRNLIKQANDVKNVSLNLEENLSILQDEKEKLLNELDGKSREIDAMQEVLSDRESFSAHEKQSKCPADCAKSKEKENTHLKEMLERSKETIKRISNELAKQTEQNKFKYKCCPNCTCKKRKLQAEPPPKIIVRCCAGCNCKQKKDKTSISKMQQTVQCICKNKGLQKKLAEEKTQQTEKCICASRNNVKGIILPNKNDEDEDLMFTARSTGEDTDIKDRVIDVSVQSVPKSQLDDCLDHLKKAQQRIAELEEENEHLRKIASKDNSDEFAMQLENDLRNCRHRIAELEQALENLRLENDALKKVAGVDTDQTQLRSELNKLKEQNTLLQAELNSCKDKIATLTHENEELKKLLTTGSGDDVLQLQLKLKECRDRLAELQKENEGLRKMSKSDADQLLVQMQTDLEKCLKEKEGLLKQLKELSDEILRLKKEREDFEKLLADNAVTTTRRSTALESEIDKIKSQNALLMDENTKLKKRIEELESINKKIPALEEEIKKLNEDNSKLKQEIENLRKLVIDPNLLEALKKENDNLRKQIKDQNSEIAKLLDKLKEPISADKIDRALLEKELKEKEALQAIIDDLRRQMKAMGQTTEAPKASGELERMLAELTKRLEDAERRAETAEDSLKKLKSSDPSAMLNAELQKLKDQLAQLEQENAALKRALSEANNENSVIKRELDKALGENKKLKDDLSRLQMSFDNLKQENSTLQKDLDRFKDGAGDAALKSENDNLKSQIKKLEAQIEDLKSQLDQANKALKSYSDKISQIEADNANLKKREAQCQIEKAKVAKDLENALTDMQKLTDKNRELEIDNTKLKQNITNLEGDIAKLRKDLDSVLNDAKKSGITIGDLQKELAALKQRLAQLEAENVKMESENATLRKELQQAKLASETANRLQDEINRLQKMVATLEQAKKDLEGKFADANAKATNASNLADELARLKKQLKDKETENDDLKKQMSAASKDNKIDSLLAGNEKLKKAMVDLENENSRLKNDWQRAIDDLKRARDDLNAAQQADARNKERIVQLENENKKLKNDLNAALDQLKKLNQEVSGLQNDNGKLRQNVNFLEDENSKLKKNLDETMAEKRKLCDELAALKDENTKRKQRIAQLESENAKLKADLDSALNQLKKSLDENKAMQDDIKRMKEKVNQLESENGKLKSTLESVPKELKPTTDDRAVKISLLQDENNKLKAEIDSLRNQIKALGNLKDENDRLKDKINGLEKDISNLRSSLGKAEQEAKNLAVELSKCKENETDLKRKITQIENEKSKLERELGDLKARADKVEGDTAKLRENEDKLKQKIAQLEAENARLKKELDASFTEAKKLAEDLAKLKTENKKLSEEIVKINADNNKLKKDLDNALSDLKKAENSLADLRNVEQKLKQRISQLEGENSRIKSDLNNALDEMRKTGLELSKLRDAETQAKQKLAQLEAENAKFKKQAEQAVGSSESTNAELIQLRADNNKLKQKVASLEDELTKLRNELEKALDGAKNRVQEMSKQQDENAKNKQKAAELEKKNQKLQQDLNDALGSLKFVKDENIKLKDENSKLRNLMSDLEAQIAKLKSELNAVKSQQKDTSTDKEDKEKAYKTDKENEQLKRELEKALADAKKALDLQKDNEKLKKRLFDLESEIERLKKELEKAHHVARGSLIDVGKAKDNEANFKQQNAQLQAENVDLKNEIDQLRAQLAKLKKENAEAMANLKTQCDRELKKLIKDHEDAIAKLQTAQKEAIKKLNEDHDREVKSLKDRINSLLAEMDKLKKLLKDTAIDDTRDIGSQKSVERGDLSHTPDVTTDDADKLRAEIARLNSIIKKLQTELDAANKEKDRLRRILDDQRRKSVDIKEKVDAVEIILEKERRKSKELEKVIKEHQPKGEIPSKEIPVKKEDKLTMKTFDTVFIAPDVIPIIPPLSDSELKFFGKKPCPCATTIDDILKKALQKGIRSLPIEELQVLHNHISNSAAAALEKLGKKSGVLRPNEGDRLSLMRRIAELEGDLIRKQNMAQQKLSEVQNTVKKEKDKLSQLRQRLEADAGRNPQHDSTPNLRTPEALQAIKNDLENKLREELLNKMRLEERLSHRQRLPSSNRESPVKDRQMRFPSRR